MVLDLGLVKEILLRIESAPANTYPRVEVSGRDDAEVLEHLELMLDAGLIAGKPLKAGIGNDRLVDVHVERMTWDGHQFLANAKNDGPWRKALALVVEKGGAVSLDVFKELLKKVTLQHFGVTEA